MTTIMWRAKVLPFIVLALGACGGAELRDHEPSSPDEEGIQSLLVAFEDAWNNHDKESLLPLLHEDFVIWSTAHRRIVLSKESTAFRLRDLMLRYRHILLGRPDIWIKGERATVSIPLSVDGRSTRGLFRLIQKDGRWLFLDWEF